VRTAAAITIGTVRAQPIARRLRWRAPTRSDQVRARKRGHTSSTSSQQHQQHRNADHRLDVTVETRRAFARPGRQGFPRSSALRGLDSGLASAGAPVSAAVGCRDRHGHRSTSRRRSRDSSTRRPRRNATPAGPEFRNHDPDPEMPCGSFFESRRGSLLASVAGLAYLRGELTVCGPDSRSSTGDARAARCADSPSARSRRQGSDSRRL